MSHVDIATKTENQNFQAWDPKVRHLSSCLVKKEMYVVLFCFFNFNLWTICTEDNEASPRSKGKHMLKCFAELEGHIHITEYSIV